MVLSSIKILIKNNLFMFGGREYMHNRIKALIVAAMVFTNTVSPKVEVLANEIEIEKASENIANTVSIEEKTEENLALMKVKMLIKKKILMKKVKKVYF